jgi:hypothetical protein
MGLITGLITVASAVLVGRAAAEWVGNVAGLCRLFEQVVSGFSNCTCPLLQLALRTTRSALLGQTVLSCCICINRHPVAPCMCHQGTIPIYDQQWCFEVKLELPLCLR